MNPQGIPTLAITPYGRIFRIRLSEVVLPRNDERAMFGQFLLCFAHGIPSCGLAAVFGPGISSALGFGSGVHQTFAPGCGRW